MTDDIWTFLARCRTCGEAHRQRQLSSSQATWADPTDGHHYRPHLQPHQLADLRAKWEQAQTPA